MSANRRETPKAALVRSIGGIGGVDGYHPIDRAREGAMTVPGANCNLHVSFHHGAFSTEEATQRAAVSAAVVIDDIQADVRQSFEGGRRVGGAGSQVESLIILESVDDNPRFADLVRAELIQLNPALGQDVTTAPSLARAAKPERARYLAAGTLRADAAMKEEWLRHLASTGHKTDQLDMSVAFDHIKLVTVSRGEVLVREGEPACFVYIPLSDGLQVSPLGGYEPRSLPAWMPVGTTAVISSGVRNGTVTAERDMMLLMIPKDTYLQHWYDTYSVGEFIRHVAP